MPAAYLLRTQRLVRRAGCVPTAYQGQTRDAAFDAASLQQLIAAARLPNSGISEVAVNARMAYIEGAPRDELECGLVSLPISKLSNYVPGFGVACKGAIIVRRFKTAGTRSTIIHYKRIIRQNSYPRPICFIQNGAFGKTQGVSE